MKIKTRDLEGAALDWAVAMCEGYDDIKRNPHAFDDRWIIRKTSDPHQRHWLDEYSPSTKWAQGGPIIERLGIGVRKVKAIKTWHWEAALAFPSKAPSYGPTPLVAAMRCLVSAKLGDEIDVPEELT